MGLHQKDALEVRGSSGIDEARHLPEDVGGHGAAGKKDMRSVARDDVTGCLEDEDVRGGAVDGDAVAGSREGDVAAPFVHARREGLAGDDAGPYVELGRIRSCARGRVGVGRLAVADGRRQHCWRWRRVVGRETLADHLRRGGVDGTYSGDQTEARQGAGRDRGHANVARDDGVRDARDARLGEDREVASFAKENGRSSNLLLQGARRVQRRRRDHKGEEGDRTGHRVNSGRFLC